MLIAWENKLPEEEDWEEMDYFLWQHFQFPFSWPHFSSCLSLRGDSGKAAGPYIAASLREQQCSAQHWQHTEHPLLQQQCHLTRGHGRGAAQDCGDIRQQLLNVERIGLVASGKNEEGFFYEEKEKKTDFVLGKPLCVWVCIWAHNAWVNTACWILLACYATCDKATNFTVLQPVLGVCGPSMWNLCQFGKMLLCLYDFFSFPWTLSLTQGIH